MRLTFSFCGWFLLVASASLPAAQKTFDFTTEKVGSVPAGWQSLLAGEGSPGDWQVQLAAPTQLATAAAPGAASPHQQAVLAQVSTDPTDERFPLLVYTGDVYGDFVLRLRFRTVAGTREQMAGVAFRMQDTNNFYVVRASTLGSSFRFYRVFQGRRDPPIGPSIPVAGNVWHDLEIQAQGNRFRFRLDGQEPIPELTDNTFRDGRIALWTKSDSGSQFTDLRLDYTPQICLARHLVTETLQKYPRLLGLRIYSTTSTRPELHVVAAGDPADLGVAGGEVEQKVVATRTPYAGKGRTRYFATLPLHDANGDAVAAVRIEFEKSAGLNDATAVARARPLVKAMEGRFATVKDLTE
jgi:hypothetical protein